MPLIQHARQYVEQHISTDFHDKRLARLAELKLKTILKKKNPYLFKAKAITSAPDLVKQLLQAYLSSQEETVFGRFLEDLSIHICQHAYDYIKLCGQDFWSLISGEPLLYQDIIEPLGHEAERHNDAFAEAFGRLHTKFTEEFIQEFCRPDRSIDWAKILDMNAGNPSPWKIPH